MTTRTNTQTFRREQDLAHPVRRYLRNRAFRRQVEEMPFYEYRMDMYGYSRRDDLTVAVELKLKKWTRAIEQALLYQLCSDLVYIAMPSEQVEKGAPGVPDRTRYRVSLCEGRPLPQDSPCK